MHAEVLRCLHIGYARILDQAHRLKLELSRKLPSLHDPPPAPSKHLTRCLRNRVQASFCGAIQHTVLPPPLSALASSFSSNGQPIRFVPTDHTFFGITPDSRTVLDFRLRFSASGYVSSKLEPTQIGKRLAAGGKRAGAMNPKVTRFFQLALDEDDPLRSSSTSSWQSKLRRT